MVIDMTRNTNYLRNRNVLPSLLKCFYKPISTVINGDSTMKKKIAHLPQKKMRWSLLTAIASWRRFYQGFETRRGSFPMVGS